ncbi:SDR family oxidoreductase [Leifsonia sp. YAF41]|uniref:SDR family oxidoreductase n=1 Tax=Leifsonia sp. YAF41 TaxID=3233086 RepID=UPI003F95636E
MTAILVTGGTGTLGVPTVAALRAAGQWVRVLSRRAAPGLTTGDLVANVGLREALEGAHTVVHLATSLNKTDVDAARNLFVAARQAGIAHLVLISIVGIDRIPLPYYRDKVTIERLLLDSGVPHTILRSTQFHTLLDRIFSAQHRAPVVVAPRFRLQPIDASEVAARLVELTLGEPAGRVADIAGPEQRRGTDFARVWARASGVNRPIVPLLLPGRTYAGFAAGNALVDGPPTGRISFSDYLANRPPRPL